MTISATYLPPTTYTANGVTTSFPTLFEFMNSSDLIVWYSPDTGADELLVEGTHYNVTGGSGSTGTVETIGADSPYDNGRIIINRSTPLNQEIAARATGSFTPQQVETNFDKLVLQIQDREAILDRTMRLSAADAEGIDTELPSPAADKVIGWNAAADALENKVNPGYLGVPSSTHANAIALWGGGSGDSLADSRIIVRSTSLEAPGWVYIGETLTVGQSVTVGGSLTVSGAISGPGIITALVDDSTPQLGGALDINEKQVVLNPVLSTDQTATGEISEETVDSNGFGFGAALYMKADGDWAEAVAATPTAHIPALALALEAGTGTKKLLKRGYVRDDSWSWNVGEESGIVNLATATAGGMTQDIPATTGEKLQRLAIAYTSQIIYFNPDPTTAEIA